MKRRGSLTADIVFIALAALGVAFAFGLTANARGFVTAALVGAFAGYLVLFHDEGAPRHRAYARVAVGILFGMAIAAIHRGPPALWFGAVVFGAILGYFGSRWAKHL